MQNNIHIDVSPQQSSVCVGATTEYDDHDVLSSKDLLTDDFYFCLSSDYCKGARSVGKLSSL